MRQEVSMAVIKFCRKLFYNTPIQRWKGTYWIYTKVFRFGYPADEIAVKYFDIELVVPSGDTTIVPGIAGGFYETLELNIFKEICAKSATVADVGGNIGLFTCVAAKAVSEKVYSFEPVVANYEYLTKNVERNNLQAKVQAEQKAVGNKNETLKIYLTEGSIGTHSAVSDAPEGMKSVEVPAVTLDSYFGDRNIDVLKVDIEGYDGFALEGGKSLIARCKPTILIEYVPGHLEKCGYEPQAFVDLIFSNYDSVYAIDEMSKKVKSITAEELLAGTNTNLVASAKPEHISAVQAAVSA